MRSLCAVVVILVLAVPAFAAAPPGAEAEIAQRWQKFSDAWGRGDAAGRAALWAEDASLINPFGVEAHGRPEIQKVFEMETAGFAKGTTHTFSNFKYRFLTPSIAAVDATGEIKGIAGTDGSPMPTVTVRVFAILTKHGGKWEIKDARPEIFASMPGGPAPAAK